MMKNIPSNAFLINKLGLSNSFFPLSLEIAQKGEIIDTFICAQSFAGICDLVELFAQNNLILFGVDQCCVFDELDQPLVLEKLANKAKISYNRIDSQTLVLKKQDLEHLVIFDHYGLAAIDIGDDWNEMEVISQVITFLEHDWKGSEILLSKLKHSHLLVSSHDDCYLKIQTYNMDFPKQVFIRALKNYSEAILFNPDQEPVEITEISLNIVDTFWGDNFGLSILGENTYIAGQKIYFGICKKSYQFTSSVEYNPDFWVCYSQKDKQWTVETNLSGRLIFNG